ncbi:phenylalanine--tRNA ligase subunit alpha [Calderihabitans maritimus]|uniref:Phenylalanine--tRNA ligase alpha subunit n=1 Tax=Calderihabitans maritimus TaxID=1246530 RepID=A0A1Z5HRX0_9FIRM|nr:phenylalanine--tRNA ligase subunit alpha [Calderihabitans maritimus]GAW92272.1 phenylalanyl-tRNA synthetase alpha subunit [Calderihabitans maritimus]
MREQIEKIKEEADQAFRLAKSSEELNRLRVKYLGKKGEMTRVLRGMAHIPPEERPAVGQLANEVKNYLETVLEQRLQALKQEEKERRLAAETIDITLPGQRLLMGRKHPLTQVLDQIKEIFIGMGYAVAEGPEVEYDYYNFEALNLPKDHPARDMQDSFYITDEILLRTHTSPVQVRVMEKMVPRLPIRIIAPGKVYRRDDDATHSPMFHQVEGLLVDRHVTFGDLKGTLLAFAKQMFGDEREIRLRPSYFPFTEPSAEVDISCINCGGSGCRVCSYTGWLEILGAGMVHPRVLEMSGYDPEEVSGFAFGMGVERIAMLKYGIDDLRLLFDNDLRFLTQF